MNRFRFKAPPAWCVVVGAMALSLCAASEQVFGQSAAGTMSPVIYPAKGQTPQQADRDRYECHEWAKGQSGYDPARAAAPSASSTATAANGPSATNGLATMAKGAAGGAALAEVTNHDAGRGAATGLLGATVLGKVKEQQAMQARQQQAAMQHQAAMEQQRAMYGRGFAACLEGRGYVVK